MADSDACRDGLVILTLVWRFARDDQASYESWARHIVLGLLHLFRMVDHCHNL